MIAGRVYLIAIHFGTMQYASMLDKRNYLQIVFVPN
jgi:hypothetical protein